MEWGVVADDLTGAADVLAPLATQYRCVVALREEPSVGDWQAYAINTDSRHLLDERKVVQRVQSATRNLLLSSPKVLFKKIDSTLRGHLEKELYAMWQMVPERTPLICPAFPAMGRVVREGRLWVHGTEWYRSEFASPSDAETLSEAFGSPEGVRFADAETEADLERLAEEILEEPERWLLVGSAGLSRAVARRLFNSPPPFQILKPQKWLIVVGSRHAMSRQQVQYFQKQTGVPLTTLTSTSGEAEITSQVLSSWKQGAECVILQTEATSPLSSPSSALGRITYRVFQEDALCTAIFATGGDTALEIGHAFGAKHLHLLGEVAPGIVSSEMVLEGDIRIPLLTKAGGFGDPETLLHCLQRG
jgi:uncharacterized protein YgbK (DUF1537 family)